MARPLPPRPSSAQHARSANEMAKGNLTEARPIVPAGLLQEVADAALQATHATGVAIAFEQGFEFICRTVAGAATPEVGSKINVASGLTGVCVYSGSLQWCNNTDLDSRVDADACRLLGVRAIVIVPLLWGDRLLGIIEVFSRRPYAFGKRHLQILHDLAERITASVEFASDRSAFGSETQEQREASLEGNRGKGSVFSRLRDLVALIIP